MPELASQRANTSEVSGAILNAASSGDHISIARAAGPATGIGSLVDGATMVRRTLQRITSLERAPVAPQTGEPKRRKRKVPSKKQPQVPSNMLAVSSGGTTTVAGPVVIRQMGLKP